MSNVLRICLAGSGGQGVILCSILLAKAALHQGIYVAQSQSYGPEARGGSCKAEVVISDHPIAFPKIEEIDFLLVLTQDSLDKYINQVRKDSIVMYDTSLRAPDHPNVKVAIRLPILETATNKIGKSMTANIVALGAINSYLKICSPEVLKKVVMENVPKGTKELNMRALEAGMNLM